MIVRCLATSAIFVSPTGLMKASLGTESTLSSLQARPAADRSTAGGVSYRILDRLSILRPVADTSPALGGHGGDTAFAEHLSDLGYSTILAGSIFRLFKLAVFTSNYLIVPPLRTTEKPSWERCRKSPPRKGVRFGCHSGLALS